MTEEDAKTKWCPFIRSGYGVNLPRSTHKCIGSDCAMWDWREGGYHTDGMPHKKTDGDCQLKNRLVVSA